MNSTAETPIILLNCSVTDAVVLYKERAHHLAKTKKPSHLPQNPAWSGICDCIQVYWMAAYLV